MLHRNLRAILPLVRCFKAATVQVRLSHTAAFFAHSEQLRFIERVIAVLDGKVHWMGQSVVYRPEKGGYLHVRLCILLRRSQEFQMKPFDFATRQQRFTNRGQTCFWDLLKMSTLLETIDVA